MPRCVIIIKLRRTLGAARKREGAVGIRIALCDDESRQLAETETILGEYHALHPETELAVDGFSSGSALLERVEAKGAFDVYLLDVIMPEENGIELGLRIRELDQRGRIFYLTSSPDFAVDSYQTKASGYLLKPLDREMLFRSLDEVREQLARENETYITIKLMDGLQRVPLREIMYVELVRRCVQYHLWDGTELRTVSLRSSFQNAVRPLLEDRSFALCAKSFVVNLGAVEKVEKSTLRISGGQILPLSRSFKRELTERWLEFNLNPRGEDR